MNFTLKNNKSNSLENNKSNSIFNLEIHGY